MERKTYCDYLRIMATFAVVMNHVAASNWYSTDVNSIEWRSFNFYDSIVRWAVPVFVMISGALFLNKNSSVKKIYSKNILRLVIVFVVWSLFYALATPDTLEYGIFGGLMMHADAIILGHYHMWFIRMIIGLYMCIPIYRKIVEDKNTMRYFLTLSFVFTILCPWIIKLANDYISVYSESIPTAFTLINSTISGMGLSTVLGYSFYFILGYYLDSIEISRKNRKIIYICGIAGFVFTVLVDLNLAIKTQQPCDTYYGVFDVNIMLEAICIYILFKYHDYKNPKINSIAHHLSAYMLGAFLIHVFFIGVFTYLLGFTTLSFNAFVSVPVISVIVFVCSLLISAILNHIPIIRKYCV